MWSARLEFDLSHRKRSRHRRQPVAPVRGYDVKAQHPLTRSTMLRMSARPLPMGEVGHPAFRVCFAFCLPSSPARGEKGS